ncbi:MULTISPECIES: hypothetical protein [unclassified Acidovorax]|uniref:hypothetical protein n=1 Tax=unclassified Acidovorax TaxID=2684926 RepID=UPI002882FE7B|nr:MULTISPECIES: hypothetical protein [unclassified Acidovorax]
MGTISQRRKRDGSLSYTAQIRILRDGAVMHSEAQTYSRRALASQWMRRREVELEQAMASGRPLVKGVSVDELIGDYVSASEGAQPWGRSKTADIAKLRTTTLAKPDAMRLTVQDVVDHVDKRRKTDGAGPATILNDLVWLRQVFMRAAAVRNLGEPLEVLDRARGELLRSRAVAKAGQRTRRLSAAEEAQLLEHFAGRHARSLIPMVDIVQFALLTARRQEEICRLRWADVDEAKGAAGWTM